MKITLQQDPKRADVRWIMVDGVRWGDVWRTHHGRYPKTYTFHYPDAGALTERVDSKIRPERDIVVKGQSSREFRQARPGDEIDMRSTDERITDKIKELIEAGKLKHPDQRAAELAERSRLYREACDAAEVEKLERWNMQIATTLFTLEGYNLSQVTKEDVAKITALMKWAQTQ